MFKVKCNVSYHLTACYVLYDLQCRTETGSSQHTQAVVLCMQPDDFWDCGIKHQAMTHNQPVITPHSADTTARSSTLARKKRINTYIETAIAEGV